MVTVARPAAHPKQLRSARKECVWWCICIGFAFDVNWRGEITMRSRVNRAVALYFIGIIQSVVSER